MKRLILAIALLIQVSAYAQSIPNPDFESWSSVTQDNPNYWYTSNRESIPKDSVLTATKATGQSGYAIHLETHIVGTDTLGGYITNTMGDPSKAEGGVPYSQQPTGLTGYYRYDIMPGDTGLILVIFKNSGSIVGEAVYPITGSQSAFTTFNMPLTLASAPDSVIIAAASSNLINNVGIQSGSYLELDSLAFTGTGITQAIPGGNFDNWTTDTVYRPAEWHVYGDSITRTTDSYSGTYAIQLKTIDYGGGNISGPAISSGKASGSGVTGGLPYANTSDTLIGYYKYSSPGVDTAGVYIQLTQNGTVVGGNGMNLFPAAAYTQFKVPFSAYVTPDTISITFAPSKGNGVGGSTLFLDDLQLASSITTGIHWNQIHVKQVTVYPNPAQDVLSIAFEKPLSGNASLKLYDATGKMVVNKAIVSGSSLEHVNIVSLASGVYYYEITEGQQVISDKFVKE